MNTGKGACRPKGTIGSWEGELGHALTNVILGGAESCVVPRLKGLPEQGFLTARVCMS